MVGKMQRVPFQSGFVEWELSAVGKIKNEKI
jgi:hypothetical protein